MESSFDGVRDCSHALGIAASYACRRIRKVTPLLLLGTVGVRDQSLFRDASAHQRHKAAAAGDLEFAENCVNVLFHRRQAQAGVISDLLITPTIADKSDNFLFSARKPDEMRQTGARRLGTRSSLTAQIFALDQKMRLRHAA